MAEESMRYQAPDLEGTNKVPGRGFRVVLDTDHMAELQSAYDNGYEVARAQMEEHCEDLGRARGDIRTLTAESETIERLRSIGAKEEEHEPPYIDCSVFENQKLCVGYAGGCDGDLTAMAHDDFCPARANDVILRPHLYSAQPAKGEEHALPETTESKIIGNTGEYSVRAACENCGHRGHIIAKRGTLVTGVYTCPYCGCKTLRADWKQERNMPERVIPTNFQDDETLVFKVASLLMRVMCSQASAQLLARDILAVVRPLIEAQVLAVQRKERP